MQAKNFVFVFHILEASVGHELDWRIHYCLCVLELIKKSVHIFFVFISRVCFTFLCITQQPYTFLKTFNLKMRELIFWLSPGNFYLILINVIFFITLKSLKSVPKIRNDMFSDWERFVALSLLIYMTVGTFVWSTLFIIFS